MKFAALSLLLLVMIAGVGYSATHWVLSHWTRDDDGLMALTSHPPIQVALISNGIHTDLVLPLYDNQGHLLYDWRPRLAPAWADNSPALQNARYLAIGWGDRGFYIDTPTWGDLTVKTAASALLGLGPSALHVTPSTTLESGDHVRYLGVSPSQYQHLVNYVNRRFKTDTSQQWIPIANARYDADDRFFEAHGRYSLFYTCNTWVAQGLHEAGLPNPRWTVLDKPLLRRYALTPVP